MNPWAGGLLFPNILYESMLENVTGHSLNTGLHVQWCIVDIYPNKLQSASNIYTVSL